MLIHLATIIFCTVVSAKISRVDIIYPTIETFENGKRRIAFQALQQDIDMMVEPAGDIISEKFSIMNGNGDTIHSTDVARLKQKLYKNKEMMSAVHIDEDGPPIINGIINSQLRIKPNDSKTMTEDGRVAHKIIEIEEDKLFHSSVEEKFPLMLKRIVPFQEKETKRNKSKCIKIEYMFVTESHFTEMFRDEFDLMVYVSNTVNKAKIVLSTIGLNIQVSVLGIITITRESESTAPYIKTGYLHNNPEFFEAYSLLKGMSRYYCNKKVPIMKKADIIMLLIKRPMFALNEETKEVTESEGIAFTGGVCQTCNQFAVSKDNSTINDRANTIAHETAHLIGCVHDGRGPMKTIPNSPGALDCPANKGYIMGNRTGENASKFSPCCKKNVENLIKYERASCILEKCFE